MDIINSPLYLESVENMEVWFLNSFFIESNDKNIIQGLTLYLNHLKYTFWNEIIQWTDFLGNLKELDSNRT